MLRSRMRLAFPLFLGSAVCLSIFGLAPQGKSQTYEGKQLVHAALVADTKAIVPGKSFTVGLLLRMAPGWHTYWKFSGDAGLPSEIKWNLPDGWKVGDIQWPIPLKTTDPGDIQTYGYQDEVLLMQGIIPPAKIDSSSVKLSAETNWLVCERICIPGSASLQLELPTSTTSAPANTERFARFRRLLPQDWPGAEVVKANWTRAGSDLRLSLTSATLANYPAADFFPLPPVNVVVGHPKIESRQGDEIAFRIPIESANKDLSSLRGLVVFAQHANGNDRAAWQIASPAVASAGFSTPARGVFTFLFFGLFGVFEISLPQPATRGLLSWTASEGEAGSFFQGVFATVLATPCTAPFLGTALGFAFTQSPAIILSMFVAIAAGMSAPYLLLCAQPAWLRFLPKPGPWMVHVKQFMGFLLLATLLFLLYVLGAQRGLDGIIWASCFLLIVSVICWMKGAFFAPVASTRTRVIAALMMAVLLAASGVYFIGEKFAFAKISNAGSQLTGDWQAFTPERLQT